MNITPEQAASLAENYVEPHEMPDCPDAVELWEAAYDLAQTIAGMTEQWRHEAWHDRGDGVGPWRSLCWPHDDGWRNTRESADFDLAQADGTFKHRLVRRLVGPVEVTE